MPRPISPGERHTYDEWRALGYQVQRGEHSYSRGEQGQALFGPEQVRPRNTAPPQGWQNRPRARARPVRVETPRAVPNPRQDMQYVPQRAWDVETSYTREWLDGRLITTNDTGQVGTATSYHGNWLYSEAFSALAPRMVILDDPFRASGPPTPPPVVQRAVAQYAPQDEPSGFQRFNRNIAKKET